MAKKIEVSSYSGRSSRLATYEKQINAIYNHLIREMVGLGVSLTNYDPDKPFTFSQYPQTKEKVDKLLDKLFNRLSVIIKDATATEWEEANKINDQLVDDFFRKTNIDKKILSKFYNRNLEALEVFQNRKLKGLNLSERIWKYTEEFKADMEMCLDVGLGEGRSAAQLSRDVRSFLNDPKRLYRRIRDKETDTFYLSQNAKKYQPGPGMYRSSYKNALRMTRTEINMAYRMSDHLRWQQMDFIIGYEIICSNNPNSCKDCVALAGKYPKDFIWTGWHPQCRCNRVPILADVSEFVKHLTDNPSKEYSSPEEITVLPKNFSDWHESCQSGKKEGSVLPYFLVDNRKKYGIA